MYLKRTAPSAGVYAEGRYQRGLRSWRRRANVLALSIFGPFIAVAVAMLFVEGHEASWLAGLVAGAFMAMWICLRDSPPGYVENWQIGAEGERKTEKALARLEKTGWRSVHDIQVRYGNLDHVTVGPGGAYLLESKNLRGMVEIYAGAPRLKRRHDPEAQGDFRRVRQQALHAAARLNENIAQSTGERIWVQAVVVLWSEFPAGVVDEGRCVFIHGSRLRGWLRARPQRLSPGQIEQIAGVVEEMRLVGDGEGEGEAA
jgi:hypothetical protein